jgi:hypothetical protein
MRSIGDASFAEVRAAKAFTRPRRSTQARAFLFALYLCAYPALLNLPTSPRGGGNTKVQLPSIAHKWENVRNVGNGALLAGSAMHLFA